MLTIVSLPVGATEYGSITLYGINTVESRQPREISMKRWNDTIAYASYFLSYEGMKIHIVEYNLSDKNVLNSDKAILNSTLNPTSYWCDSIKLSDDKGVSIYTELSSGNVNARAWTFDGSLTLYNEFLINTGNSHSITIINISENKALFVGNKIGVLTLDGSNDITVGNLTDSGLTHEKRLLKIDSTHYVLVGYGKIKVLYIEDNDNVTVLKSVNVGAMEYGDTCWLDETNHTGFIVREYANQCYSRTFSLNATYDITVYSEYHHPSDINEFPVGCVYTPSFFQAVVIISNKIYIATVDESHDISYSSGTEYTAYWSMIEIGGAYLSENLSAFFYDYKPSTDTRSIMYELNPAITNHAPDKPTCVSPTDNEFNVPIDTTLKVHITDVDGDTMSVDFYYDDDTLIQHFDNQLNDTDVETSALSLEYGTEYKWYAVVNDSILENTSDTFTFNTLLPSNTYVDDNQIPSWYDFAHVKTIQEGIDNVSSGGTVYIYNGTYAEDNILVNKTLNIVGESKNNVIVTYFSVLDTLFYVTSDNVNISNLTIGTIYLAPSTATRFEHSNFSTISNCNIVAMRTGIYISYSENVKVENCNINSTQTDGIRFRYNSPYGKIYNCTINTHGGQYYGIRTTDTIVSYTEVNNCTVYGTMYFSGVYLTVTNCTVYNNDTNAVNIVNAPDSVFTILTAFVSLLYTVQFVTVR